MEDKLHAGDIVQFKTGVFVVLFNDNPSIEGMRAQVDLVDDKQVWFRMLPTTDASQEIIEALNGLGDGGPLFYVNEENPLVVMHAARDASWHESLEQSLSFVCNECATPIPDDAEGRFFVANEQEGVYLRLCDDCLRFECEACGEKVVEVAYACDRCSAPVCSVCFETNHNCCAKAVRS
jgi:hypothetical protein